MYISKEALRTYLLSPLVMCLKNMFLKANVPLRKFYSNQSYLCFKNELGDYNRVFLGDGTGLREIILQISMIVSHVHGSTTQHVGRPYQTRKSYLVTKLLGTLKIKDDYIVTETNIKPRNNNKSAGPEKFLFFSSS